MRLAYCDKWNVSKIEGGTHYKMKGGTHYKLFKLFTHISHYKAIHAHLMKGGTQD